MAVLNHLSVQGDHFGQTKHSLEGRRTARQGDWVRGWWEHISTEPVFIRDKAHLKQVCQEHSRRTGRLIIPKAFAKPRSQGQGIEWTY